MCSIAMNEEPVFALSIHAILYPVAGMGLGQTKWEELSYRKLIVCINIYMSTRERRYRVHRYGYTCILISTGGGNMALKEPDHCAAVGSQHSGRVHAMPPDISFS